MAKRESNEKNLPAQITPFNYQLEIIKKEIDLINDGLARFDENGRQTKYLAIFTWAGSMGIVLGNPDLHRYAILVAIIPFIFWLADTRWTNVLRAFVFRLDKISEFLNSDNFRESFEKQRLVKFTLLDPRGDQYEDTDEYKKKVNFWRSLRRWENSPLYLGLIIISITVGVFFIINP